MYQIGDLIVYGRTGVCKVAGFTKVDNRDYYILDPLYKKCTITAPVDGTKICTRYVMTRNEVDDLIKKIPQIRAEAYHNKNLSQLRDYYKSLLSTLDSYETLKLAMSIYAKKQEMAEQKRKFGATDEKFMKEAEEMLFGEFAAVLEIPIDSVQEYISSQIESLNQ